MTQFTTTPGGSYLEAAEANILTVTGELNPAETYTTLRLADGRIVRIETTTLLSETSAMVPASFETPLEMDTTVIPLVEERLSVGKRTVATGTVRLSKTVQEYEEALHEPLAVRTFDVERVILNRPVDTAPVVRVEGETTIYPVVEEQLILTKQLILKEEVRVTQRDTERIDTQVVTLRREHLEVERESVKTS